MYSHSFFTKVCTHLINVYTFNSFVNAGLIFPLLSGEIFPVSSKKLFEANGSDFQAVLHSVGIRL
jgi:hypothetical protein